MKLTESRVVDGPFLDQPDGINRIAGGPGCELRPRPQWSRRISKLIPARRFWGSKRAGVQSPRSASSLRRTTRHWWD